MRVDLEVPWVEASAGGEKATVPINGKVGAGAKGSFSAKRVQ